jgi:4-hydroxy-4-methyl-2-oxoglutarate aldolase
VVCAGVLVEPGDIVIGDDDGVVVVPKRIASEIVKAATAFLEREKGFRAMLSEQYVSFGAAKQLEQHGYRFV